MVLLGFLLGFSELFIFYILYFNLSKFLNFFDCAGEAWGNLWNYQNLGQRRIATNRNVELQNIGFL